MAMSELRNDLVTGRVVLCAPGRAARPHTVEPLAPGPQTVAGCPFCPGNEHETPPEVGRTGGGAPDAPGWRTRVTPNKYPIVGGGVTGAHEVVILSPDHSATFDRLAPEAAAEVLAVMRDRVAAHLGAGLAHSTAFVNHGRAAGASIEHPHGQIVALDFVPPGIADTLARCARAGGDLVASVLDDARARGLLVLDGEAPVACPFASASPYELLLAHDRAGTRFDRAGDEEIADVALALGRALDRLRTVLGEVAYNVIVHTAPPGDAPGYRWHVRVTPRLAVTAGFEHVSDVYVNPVPPETAAARLREEEP